jgi:hypothetical protein
MFCEIQAIRLVDLAVQAMQGIVADFLGVIRQVLSNPIVNYTSKLFFYSIIFPSLDVLAAVDYVVMVRRTEAIMSHDCILLRLPHSLNFFLYKYM